MKKYIIKNADGSEQTVMRAVHNSRKEAGRELMRYLSYHNEIGTLTIICLHLISLLKKLNAVT